ncbi:MAG: hypothetical protein ACM3JG_15400, partial [Thiohalocapsa sp.]
MQGLSRREVVVALAALAAIAPLGRAAMAAPAGGKPERVALKGYDPVAYFTDGKPAKGSPDFTAEFDDATYWFANAAHRALF